MRFRPDAVASWVDAQGAFDRGLPVRSGTDGSIMPGFGIGQGTGSDSDLEFTPFMFGEDTGSWNPTTRQWGGMLRSGPPPGDDRGETLLHELTHSMQQMSGRLTNAPMARYTPVEVPDIPTLMDTASELVAIVVANIYASERGRPLRANHYGSQDLTDPRVFASTAELRRQLLDFRARMPAVAARLARINTTFNPFRTLLAVA